MVELGYDEIIVSPQSTQECSYCLADNQVEAILAVCETMAFVTRWYSTSGSAIDQDTVEAFRDEIYRRLMSGCCSDNVLTQFNSDGNYQTSYDGGTTWVDTPANDPRNGLILGTPLTGDNGTVKRCQAANNIAGYYKSWVEIIAKGKDTNAGWSDISAIFIGLLIALGFITGGWIFALLGGLVALIYANYDATSWRAAFDDALWQIVVNDAYCNLGDDGQFDEAGYALFLLDIDNDLSDGIAKSFLLDFWKSVRLGGMNSAARKSETATSFDCSCSGCKDKFDVPGDAIYGIKSADQSGLADDEVRFETDAQNTNSLYYVIVISDDDASGCLLKAATDDPNIVSTTAYMGVTGNRHDYGSYTVGSPNADTQCVNGLLFAASAPFSIVLKFADC